MFLQNLYKILRWILDMLWELACLGSVSKIAQRYWRILDIDKSAYMIFVA
jgi:hypothetical protein